MIVPVRLALQWPGKVPITYIWISKLLSNPRAGRLEFGEGVSDVEHGLNGSTRTSWWWGCHGSRLHGSSRKFRNIRRFATIRSHPALWSKLDNSANQPISETSSHYRTSPPSSFSQNGSPRCPPASPCCATLPVWRGCHLDHDWFAKTQAKISLSSWAERYPCIWKPLPVTSSIPGGEVGGMGQAIRGPVCDVLEYFLT